MKQDENNGQVICWIVLDRGERTAGCCHQILQRSCPDGEVHRLAIRDEQSFEAERRRIVRESSRDWIGLVDGGVLPIAERLPRLRAVMADAEPETAAIRPLVQDHLVGVLQPVGILICQKNRYESTADKGANQLTTDLVLGMTGVELDYSDIFRRAVRYYDEYAGLLGRAEARWRAAVATNADLRAALLGTLAGRTKRADGARTGDILEWEQILFAEHGISGKKSLDSEACGDRTIAGYAKDFRMDQALQNHRHPDYREVYFGEQPASRRWQRRHLGTRLERLSEVVQRAGNRFYRMRKAVKAGK